MSATCGNHTGLIVVRRPGARIMIRKTKAQVPITSLIFKGSAFWLLQRSFFVYLEPFAPFATQNAMLIWVVMTIPFMGIMVLAMGTSLDLQAPEAFHIFAIIFGVCLLMHGLLLAIEPGLYGESPHHRAAVAALVIWSCGTGLALAYFWPGSGRFSALWKPTPKEVSAPDSASES
jgi:hypothetical protein